jgi:hypothetical protein
MRCLLWSALRPLLRKGAVNTSLQQQFNYNRRVVFSTWSVPTGHKREEVQSLVESQSVKRRLVGWCDMAASLGVSQLRH